LLVATCGQLLGGRASRCARGSSGHQAWQLVLLEVQLPGGVGLARSSAKGRGLDAVRRISTLGACRACRPRSSTLVNSGVALLRSRRAPRAAPEVTECLRDCVRCEGPGGGRAGSMEGRCLLASRVAWGGLGFAQEIGAARTAGHRCLKRGVSSAASRSSRAEARGRAGRTPAWAAVGHWLRWRYVWPVPSARRLFAPLSPPTALMQRTSPSVLGVSGRIPKHARAARHHGGIRSACPAGTNGLQTASAARPRRWSLVHGRGRRGRSSCVVGRRAAAGAAYAARRRRARQGHGLASG